MSGDVQLDLWMNEYKLDALAAVLARENTTVEQRMQDALTELYVSLVPRETRQEISARIPPPQSRRRTPRRNLPCRRRTGICAGYTPIC